MRKITVVTGLVSCPPLLQEHVFHARTRTCTFQQDSEEPHSKDVAEEDEGTDYGLVEKVGGSRKQKQPSSVLHLSTSEDTRTGIFRRDNGNITKW